MSSLSSSESVSHTEGSNGSRSESDSEMDHLPSLKPATPEKPKAAKAIAVKKAAVVKGESAIKKPTAIRKTNAEKLTTHPKTIVMINDAINELKDRKGSSLKAIVKKITETYPSIDGEKIYPHVKKAIKTGVEKENLLQVKGSGASGSFKVNPLSKPTNKPSTEKDGVKPAKKVVKKADIGETKSKTKQLPETKKPPVKKTSKVLKSPIMKPLSKPGRVPKVDKTPKNVTKPKAALKLPPSAMKSSPVMKKTIKAPAKKTAKKTTAKPPAAKKSPVKKMKAT